MTEKPVSHSGKGPGVRPSPVRKASLSSLFDGRDAGLHVAGELWVNLVLKIIRERISVLKRRGRRARDSLELPFRAANTRTALGEFNQAKSVDYAIECLRPGMSSKPMPFCASS